LSRAVIRLELLPIVTSALGYAAGGYNGGLEEGVDVNRVGVVAAGTGRPAAGRHGVGVPPEHCDKEVKTSRCGYRVGCGTRNQVPLLTRMIVVFQCLKNF